MGFEDPSGWTASPSSAVIVKSSAHDQGSFSLELHPSSTNGQTNLVSAPLSKPAVVGPQLAFDIFLPTQQPNPSWYGTAQIYLNAPSRNLNNAFLGQIELTGKPLNTWTTLSFGVADSVLGPLVSGSYTDLRITVVINVPVPAKGVYRLDNLRFVAAKPSQCPGRPNGTSCDDSNACTTGETCQSGQCRSGGTVTCTTDQCHTVGACVPATGCPAPVVKADGATCDDGNGCTLTDACFQGVCAGSNLKVCTASDACHVSGNCDPATGVCSNPLAADGTACDDGNSCTAPDACQGGVCKGGPNDGPTNPDLSAYEKPPEPPAGVDEPTVGDPFPGALNGDLSVGPTGAAMYSVPLRIPPGVNGMVPNLSLVYNSQGGDGIAGQGFELSGLSMIHRCPKTKVQDGHPRPVHMDTLGKPQADDVDGVCLDGKRLFDRGLNTYDTETHEFGSITIDPDTETFIVVTKTGETHYYGSTIQSRVQANGETAVWALDRVIDLWGNYYEVHYNEDEADYDERGLIVTDIKYTGHVADPEVDPFYTIHFEYQPRPDVRTSRFAQWTLQRKVRLSSINTNEGAYVLSYVDQSQTDPDPMLPSQLQKIQYCIGQNCRAPGGPDDPQPLVFQWQGGNFAWVPEPNYAPPLPINAQPQADHPTRLPGTQFVDLNGDGLVDFVYAKEGDPSSAVWLNTGSGFTPQADTQWNLPIALVHADGTQAATLTDMNGDGIVDIVGEGTPVCQCLPEGSPFCVQVCIPPFEVFVNHIPMGGGWEQQDALLTPPDAFKVIDFKTDSFFDINGDGYADMVRIPNDSNARSFQVLKNSGDHWAEDGSGVNALPVAPITLHFEDVNRDGFPDLVQNQSDNSADVYLNTQNVLRGSVAGSIWEKTSAPFFGGAHTLADIDGDGFYDSFSGVASARELTLGFGTSIGFTNMGVDTYQASLLAAAPQPGQAVFQDGVVAFADLNADGLVDFVENHSKLYDQGVPSGTIGINTGTQWVGLGPDHSLTWDTQSAGPNAAQVTPRNDVNTVGDNGAVFVDLDGDGVTDLAENLGPVHTGAWLNKFQPPVISQFPNRLAFRSVVSYAVITTGAAHAPHKDNSGQTVPAVYSDSQTLSGLQRHITLPLRVVSEVDRDNGTLPFNVPGATVITHYRYADLRDTLTNRGPQGFATVTVDDPDGTETVTTYAQEYPHTGMPKDVVRSNHGTLSETVTTFCDRQIAQNCDIGACAEPSVFVYPCHVEDTNVLRTSNDPEIGSPEKTVTKSDFGYDDAGNLKTSSVDTTHYDQNGNATEEWVSKTEKVYAAPGSAEEQLGRPTSATTTTERVLPANADPEQVVHHTTFEYDHTQPALPVSKQKREEGSGAPLELHTAFVHDTFGNQTIKTECATDFTDCEPAALGAAHPQPGSLPFRTTLTSFAAGDFDPAPGGVTGDVTQLPYGSGRFPVRVIDPEGLVTYSVFDPITGVLVQSTDANGGQTCHRLDILGREKETVDRCGSSQPISTLIQRFKVFATGPSLPKVVTVTRSPDGHASFVYTDQYDRVIETSSRGFDGGFDLTETTYDTLGRVHTTTTPFRDGASLHRTTTDYDFLGRVQRVTKDLGVIDGTVQNGGTGTSVVTTTYNGSSTTTTTRVQGADRSRTETKSVNGKVSQTVDEAGVTLDFEYDGDGHLKGVTQSDLGLSVHSTYDVNGRKTETTDPDLGGTWHYTYDGFGDMVEQKDARNVVIDLTYDKLGRLLSRKEQATGAMSEYVYDVAEHGKGQLAAVIGAPDSRLKGSCHVPYVFQTNDQRAGQWFTYTEHGQLSDTFECADGDTFATHVDYDDIGRVARQQYPEVNGTRFAVDYAYTQFGHLQYLADDADGTVIWAAKAMNFLGQVTDEQTRNGVETVTTRSSGTGWVLSASSTAHADGETVLQNAGYRYDEVGSLRGRLRADAVVSTNTTETFDYDARDRLSQAKLTRPSQPDVVQNYHYDDLGNLTQKDGNDYTYGTCGAGPHAVCAVTGRSAFNYDANGNFSGDADRAVNYDANNRPIHLEGATTSTTGGPAVVDLVYDGQLNRVVQISNTSTDGSTPDARVVYVGMNGSGKSLYERTTRGDSVEHAHFIYAAGLHGGNALGLRIVTQAGSSAPTTANKFYVLDHLGSVTAVSNDSGHVHDVECAGVDADVMSYDAWGARRDPNGGTSPASAFALTAGHRGFTSHESLPDLGLVNMNGRIYDPVLGRFLSPDPTVQFEANLQSYNRYSYVLNNPLRYTDPTGYSIFSSPLFTSALFLAGTALCGGDPLCGEFMFMMSTMYTATSALAAGASLQQVALSTALGVAGGQFGGAFGKSIGQAVGGGVGGNLLGGAVGNAISSSVSALPTGGKGLGKAMLTGTLEAAVKSVAGWYGSSEDELSRKESADSENPPFEPTLSHPLHFDGLDLQLRAPTFPAFEGGTTSMDDALNQAYDELNNDRTHMTAELGSGIMARIQRMLGRWTIIRFGGKNEYDPVDRSLMPRRPPAAMIEERVTRAKVPEGGTYDVPPEFTLRSTAAPFALYLSAQYGQQCGDALCGAFPVARQLIFDKVNDFFGVKVLPLPPLPRIPSLFGPDPKPQ